MKSFDSCKIQNLIRTKNVDVKIKNFEHSPIFERYKNMYMQKMFEKIVHQS